MHENRASAQANSVSSGLTSAHKSPSSAEMYAVRSHFNRHFKRLMSVWRVLHVVLAILLVGLIGLHVWVSVRVGFRWLWS